MDIETYADQVLDRLEKAGVDMSNKQIGMLIAHCHGKGVEVERAATDIAKKLKENA